MKRKLLLLTFLLTAYLSNAQFEVFDKSDNSQITEGQVFTFSEAGCSYPGDCNFKFKVTNTSAQDIYMRIFVDGLTGTNGDNFQLCFAGVCLNNIALNNGYPNTAALITAGSTNSAGNNFWNQNTPGNTTPMSWTFRFQAFDAGGTEIGTPLTMTYNYNPALSIDDAELVNVNVYPTSVKNKLNVISNDDLTADFYNILGKRVKQVSVKNGDSTIDISDLTAQIYVVRFTNNEGKQVLKKIVKE
ncbi:MAG: T9SS type A sorting domain-containing protein [Winogradskyella sp.]